MSEAQNRARRANPLVAHLNHLWFERVAGIPARVGKGPDAANGSVATELKFSVRELGSKEVLSWTIDHLQCDYNHGWPHCFWGFGIFFIDVPYQQLISRTTAYIARHIVKRELHLVEWSYVQERCEFNRTKGTSKTKSWDTFLGYVSELELPPAVRRLDVEGGTIFLTKGVYTPFFPLLHSRFSGVCPANALSPQRNGEAL